MASIDIAEAAATLSALVGQVLDGEEIIITKYGEPVAVLTRALRKRPKLGTMAGTFKLPEEWDTPMTAKELNEWL